MKKNIKSVHKPLRKRLTVPQTKRRKKKILAKIKKGGDNA